MNKPQINALKFISISLFSIAFSFACETIPPEMLRTSPQYKNAREALAPGADVFIALLPARMPLFHKAFIKSLPASGAGTLDSVLAKTSGIYAGLERNHGESEAAVAFNYTVVAVGRYPSQQYKTALSLQKGVKNTGRWLESDSQKIAFPSGQSILLTNADMQGFLDRYTFPENRPERVNHETHPISIVDSIANDNPAAGLIAYLPNPASAQIPFLSTEDLSLPLKDLTVLVYENSTAEAFEFRFRFTSENAARVYLSSIRMLSSGLKLGLSLSGSPSLSRNGLTVSVTGLSITRGGLSNLLQPLFIKGSRINN